MERHLLKKSRSGCQECRRRKIKCNEVKPVCSNCRRRFVDIKRCEWSTTLESRTSRLDPRRGTAHFSRNDVELHDPNLPTGRISPGLAPKPLPLANIDHERSLELRLMHHYTAVVSSSMPDCNGVPARDMWDRIIPQIAFESEVVLSPMLALSALHLHAHSSSDSGMAFVLWRYLDKTLANHRQAVSTGGEGLTEQTWLSAVILSNMYWLLSRQAKPNNVYQLPSSAWQVLQGVSILFMQKKAYLTRLGYAWFGYETPPLIMESEKLPSAARALLKVLEEDFTLLFDSLCVPGLSEEKRNIYFQAREYVLYYYRAFFSGAAAKTMRRFIGTMAVRCGSGFRTMIEEHDPLAMAILARMLVLLRGLEHAWWMNGDGEYEVLERDVRGMHTLLPVDLRWMMEWPCKVLSGEIILNPRD